MKKAIDNYAQGKQIEVFAWSGESISANTGRFICPECLENVALDKRGHFRHRNRTLQSIECDKRVDSPSRTAYERMGLPLYLCKQTGFSFTLGIGFFALDKKLLEQAEVNGSFLTIGDAYHANMKYSISNERFNDSQTTIIPISFKPSGNGAYTISYSDKTPFSIRKLWTDHTDIWGEGQFFTPGEKISRKIRPLGTLVTNREYYFTGNKWRFNQFASFVKISECGSLSLGRDFTKVYSVYIDQSKSSKYDFDRLSNVLRDAFKVNLLVGESEIIPIWPPCIIDDNRITFQENTKSGYFIVDSPNDTPVIYRYNGETYESTQVTSDSKPNVIKLSVSNSEMPICVDRAFNGNIQFIKKASVTYHMQRIQADIIDEKEKSILDAELMSLRNKTIRVLTNFPAVIRLENGRKKDFLIRNSDFSGSVFENVTWNDSFSILTTCGRTVLKHTIQHLSLDSDASSETEVLKKLRTAKGQLVEVTDEIIAMFRSIQSYPKVQNHTRKYIVAGRVPKETVDILRSICGRTRK